MQSLKSIHPHVKEVAAGTVSLLAGDAVPPTVRAGSIVKRVLACYEGTFDGMYGPVEVTQGLLQGIADRYNGEKAIVQNEFDYCPILTDHIREADRTKGRLLGGLTVEPWTKLSTGETRPGLFGWLRVDNKDAQSKVDDGTYAQVSISFDEETFELYEISFVAVEAARGSMVLSKNTKSPGGKMELGKAKLASLSQKHKALAQEVKQARARRTQSLKQITVKTAEVVTEIKSLAARLETLKQTTKVSQLKARFNGFVKGGKMNPAELSKLNLKSLSALDGTSLEIVLASYENRPVSQDVFQFGQTGSPLKTVALTKESMAQAIKLQREGKTGIVLADRQEETPPVDGAKAKLEGDDDDSMSLSSEEWKATLAEIDDLHGKMGDAVDKMKALGDETNKVNDDDKKDEEREMAAAKEIEKELAADDDQTAKK